MPRTILAAATAALALAAAASTATGATLMRLTAQGADTASAEERATWNVPTRQRRIRVAYTASQVVRPYTYDANYDRVYGPDETVPVSGSGTVAIECIPTKRTAWWRSTDSRRSILANTTTTLRLPLPTAARCRVSVSADTRLTFPDRATVVSSTLGVVVTTTR